MVTNGRRRCGPFVDKTRGVNGFLPVSRKLTKDKNNARLSWVFKYSKGDDGMPVEHARLVYNHSAKNGEIFQELSYSSVCKPLHWKAFLHASIVDGATLYRRDIVNAHQSVRRGPDLEPAYSYGIPGIDLLDEEGQPADLLWLNYLNGMPSVGAAFAEDLKSHFVAFGLHRLITDDYIKVCLIVDDMLVAVKGKISIVMFNTHVEKRWDLKKPPGVDGFLNNNCYCIVIRTKR